ncbi:Dinitrogenase iron-molybdenum cofactor biosynthesis protein [Desulfurobacterium thermolithotrophum DSM 11699]|uniref:Dinitrogenase iron-molybdenum cofactor biosynthesis protein n=1 Tax=Desulfurobacterium thermolithotrophum (strain DSM 11699 / BSA) TaxID=868864 RepID=F0S2P4_DESTD|nr:NifB/NifX family molybdenum-iron cluster-binding protein [Desulfurobacterium thermolithotrophum]ADY73116.1 Dinitrogenase iron-molybdenum cofactor biosynthesis protein [Desulfurobacterium thermolithotrophum DSM 11699]
MIVAIPVEKDRIRVTNLFGPAPGFMIINTDTGEKKFINNVYACGGCKEGCIEGKNAADLLAEQKVEALLIEKISEAPFLKLLQKGIVVYELPLGTQTVDEALSLFKEGKTKVLYISST